ncbi:MAG TPA: hypothetical protein VIM70_04800 [Clostridium sp.]|uniref:hypothetical protein n=1 Tax=Clostridium sp. TaxID=1506 RepID=UPI002F94C0E4
MNKEIIRKLIKIEILKYEIIKEILPGKVVHRLNNFEKEAVTVIKDIALGFIGDTSEDHEEEIKKEVNKVKIDFL